MTYNFNNPAGIEQAECEWLTGFCRKNNIKTVLEFGPGNSTVAMLEGGATTIQTFEEDAKRAHEMRIGLNAAVHIHSYNAALLPFHAYIASGFDLAFIDGPTGKTMTPTRLNACLCALRRAPMIAIHDSKRDAQTVAIMEQIGCVVQEICNSERGIVVLRTPRILPR